MAKMCPLGGCKTTRGYCIHDKMMLGMGMLGILSLAGHWVFHLF